MGHVDVIYTYILIMAVVQHIVVFALYIFAVTRGEESKDAGVIERRFEELERRLNDHETVIGDIQRTVAAQQATIQDQQAMIHSQNRLIQQIQTELQTGQESRKKHSMLLQVIQRDIRNVKQMFEERKDTDDTGTAAETKTGDDNRIRQTETDPKLNPLTRRQERTGIAFSAYLDHDIETANHQTVKFNKLITNEGNDYNVHTGVFTCSEPGMYLLIFNIGERGAGNGLWVRLVVNSANIVDAAVDTYHDTQDMQGGNSVLLRLKAGDSVWVENAGGSHVEGSDGMRWTTFSGVFLYQ